MMILLLAWVSGALCVLQQQQQHAGPLDSHARRIERIREYARSGEMCKAVSKHPSLLHKMSCKNEASSDEEVAAWAEEYTARHNVQASDLDPVVFVPGFAGSGIDGYLDRKNTAAWFCIGKWRSWFNLWIALYEVLTNTCLLDNTALRFNSTDNTFANQEGVETRPRDFGGLSGIDYVDNTDDFFGFTIVYAEMTKHFRAIGYQDGVNLFGAPFDFRVPLYATLTNGFGDDFFKLVELAYSKNQKKVHIVSHSYGGPVVLYWMNNYRPKGYTTAQWNKWVETHIHTFVPIAGPWSGVSTSLRAVVSGDTFGMPNWIVYPETVAKTARTFGGLVQLFPDPLFWPKNMTFVETPTRNYTASETDVADLLAAVGATDAAKVYELSKHAIDSLSQPLMRTVCLYGFDHDTEISFVYGNGLSKDKIIQPTQIDMSNQGDGTVPLQSLLECQLWETQQPKNIQCREYDTSGHADLQDKKMIEDIIAIVTGKDDIKTCETHKLDEWVAAQPVMPEKARMVREARLRNNIKQ